MVLNAFDLTGKVAIVTGCDTGLGQGMTLGLAQAGCDIVGINRKIPHDTAAQVLALGRRFHAGSIFWSTTPELYAAMMP